MLDLHHKCDVLQVNSTTFDFTALAEGEMNADGATGSPMVVGPVTRTDGVARITLMLPHGPAAPDAVRFPLPLPLRPEGDGPVPRPT